MAEPWQVADPVQVEAPNNQASGDGGIAVVRSVGRVGSSPPGPSPFIGEDFAALRRRALDFEGGGSSSLSVTWWGVDQQLWTTTPTRQPTAWEWDYILRFHYTLYFFNLATLASTRDTLEMQLRVANPSAWGVEWENNAPGSYAVQVIPQPNEIHQTQTWDSPTGPVTTDNNSPGDATAFWLLNIPGIDLDSGAPSFTALADPDLGNVLLGAAPANYPTAGVSPLLVPDAYLSTHGIEDTGARETIYAVAVTPYGATVAPATTYGNPEIGTLQVAAGDVALVATYTPPRFRYFFGPTVPVVDNPWLRAIQRSDGLGAGGPPRAVQQATRNDSVRSGTGII